MHLQWLSRNESYQVHCKFYGSWNPEFKCFIRNNFLIIFILIRINPISSTNTYLFKICLNIVLQSKPRFPRAIFILVYLLNIESTPDDFNSDHLSCRSHFFRFIHPNYVRWNLLFQNVSLKTCHILAPIMSSRKQDIEKSSLINLRVK